MRTIEIYGTFADIIKDASPQIVSLAWKLRALIEEIYPAVVEVPWPTQRVVGYGVGPRKATEHFCYLSIQRGHINLGFNYGAELPDPTGLLEGSGKLFRHVKLSQEAALANPALRALLHVATTHRMPTPPTP